MNWGEFWRGFSGRSIESDSESDDDDVILAEEMGEPYVASDDAIARAEARQKEHSRSRRLREHQAKEIAELRSENAALHRQLNRQMGIVERARFQLAQYEELKRRVDEYEKYARWQEWLKTNPQIVDREAAIDAKVNGKPG